VPHFFPSLLFEVTATNGQTYYATGLIEAVKFCSTGARLLTVCHFLQVVMGAHSGKAKGRATKRKNSASVTSEPPKTYSRRGQQQTTTATTTTTSRGGIPAKKLLLANDQSTFAVSAARFEFCPFLKPKASLHVRFSNRFRRLEWQ